MRKEQTLKLILIIVAAALGLLYAGDYLSVRYRIPKSRDPFGTVQVQRYYSVAKKNGKPDFYFDPPNDQTCVHSLFPHLGYDPCWYVNRHKLQEVQD